MRRLAVMTALVVVAATIAGGSYALARDGNGGGAFNTTLSGWQEVPTQVRMGEGRFHAKVRHVGGEPVIEYVLRYSGLEGDAAQAHIHVGDEHENGAVATFLCGGQDKPPCPLRAGEVRGTIDRPDVGTPQSAGQGVATGEIEDLIRAMRRGEAYANVHTTVAGGGEIRGDLRRGGGRD